MFPIVHDFDESLRRSHAAEDLPFWEECYRNAFYDFAAMVNHRADGEHQRAGIDRSVILSNSKQYLIDEKIRWEAYDDIALEYISNDQKGTPGWVCKPLRADYIAYAVAPKGICYLLPVPQLQQAWRVNQEKWRAQKLKIIAAKNRTYTTFSLAVPVNVLFAAIGAGLRVRFTPVYME